MNLLDYIKGRIPALGYTSATYTASADGTGTGVIAGTVDIAYVAGGDDSKIITLPAPVKGKELLIVGTVKAKAIVVYADVTGTKINGKTALHTGGLTLAAATGLYLRGISATEWLAITVPLLPQV